MLIQSLYILIIFAHMQTVKNWAEYVSVSDNMDNEQEKSDTEAHTKYCSIYEI